MIRISTPEFRKNFVQSYLKEKQKNADLSISFFKKNNFPDVGIKSAYNWIRQYKASEGKALNMTENEVNGLYGTEANSMSLKDKLEMVLDTAGLNEEQIGTYCRQHGIYKSDLDSWKIECLSALDEGTGTINHKQQKAEIKELKQKVSRLEKESVRKDKEIDRKDKALATYAAQISTLKNFHKLFTSNSNEED